MTSRHVFVADDGVVRFFTERTRREREELLRAFTMLAEAPDQN